MKNRNSFQDTNTKSKTTFANWPHTYAMQRLGVYYTGF